ncbi:MAG: hypothetical protein K6C40_00090 [Thermoguttaceae bacterium]|nr:hypothetical protein [Thermoguttaceae bacterium]
MNTKNQLTFYLILTLSAIFILTAFYLEGRATERFGQSFDTHLKSFKDAVENAVPTKVGDWFSESTEDQIGIENELIRRVAGADGALGRHYRGSSDTPDIQVNLTCGYSRNVGAHTPDVCFTGSGSVQETSVETYSVDYQVRVPDPADPAKSVSEDRTATFKTAIFSDASSHYKQRVFWGWKGVETGWVAPRFPRLYWNSNEPICKMYVSLLEDNGYGKEKVDTLKVAEKFLQEFLPELDAILTGTYALPEESLISDDGSANVDAIPPAPVTNEGGQTDEDDLSLPPAPGPEASAAPEISSEPEVKEPENALTEPTEAAGPADKSDEDDEFAL